MVSTGMYKPFFWPYCEMFFIINFDDNILETYEIYNITY